jgi:predicted MPP superfamily phosphohydrolase
MTLLTRRHILQGAGALTLAGAGAGVYACVIEPGFRLDITTYRLTPPHWTPGLDLKAAVIADIHACEPQMSAARIRHIAEVTNSLNPDIVFLLGDFNAGHRFVTGPVYPEQWAEALSVLRAPLGVFAILGNHDWWHGALTHMRSDDAAGIRSAMRQADFRLLENEAVGLMKNGLPFWVAGLGDQLAHPNPHWQGFQGNDDLDGTLAQADDGAPVLLLAHEPFVFPRVPERVSLTLCGHTHGGQVNLPIITERYTESEFGMKKVYGHIVEGGRHMIISAGLGTSIAPVRLFRPPEIVLLNIGSASALA